MRFENFKEMHSYLLEKQNKYNECNHEFDDKPSYFRTIGRYGGAPISYYQCLKCGFETCDIDQYTKELNNYDDRGCPKQ